MSGMVENVAQSLAADRQMRVEEHWEQSKELALSYQSKKKIKNNKNEYNIKHKIAKNVVKKKLVIRIKHTLSTAI